MTWKTETPLPLRQWSVRKAANLWMKWFSSRYRQPKAMSLAICSSSRMLREEHWPWRKSGLNSMHGGRAISHWQREREGGGSEVRCTLTARGLFCLRKLFMSPPVISSSKMKRGRMFRLTPMQRTMFSWLNLLQSTQKRLVSRPKLWLLFASAVGPDENTKQSLKN